MSEPKRTRESKKTSTSSSSRRPRSPKQKRTPPVRIYHSDTGLPILGPREGHTAPITSVSFSPDGKRVVSTSIDGTVRIWDARTGKLINLLHSHTKIVLFASFSPDGQFLVSVSDDDTTTTRIWDASTGTLLHVLTGPPSRTYDYYGHKNVSFSSDGKLFASIVNKTDADLCFAGIHSRVNIRNTRTGGEPVRILQHRRHVTAFSFSPARDDYRLVTSMKRRHDGATVQMWNAKTGKCIGYPLSLQKYPQQICFLADGKSVVCVRERYIRPRRSAPIVPSTHLTFLDAEPLKIRGTFIVGPNDYYKRTQCDSVSVSSDGTRVVTSYTGRYAKRRPWCDFVMIHAMMRPTSQYLLRPRRKIFLRGHRGKVKSVSFSPDGTKCVSGGSDCTIRIWGPINLHRLIHLFYEKRKVPPWVQKILQSLKDHFTESLLHLILEYSTEHRFLTRTPDLSENRLMQSSLLEYYEQVRIGCKPRKRKRSE